MKIILKKVWLHNLKGVDLEIDRNQFVVFTGISGSGKSSLVFDTLYVEGKKKYLQLLSFRTKKKQLVVEQPKAEMISGLSPTVGIRKKSRASPRSTVGTITGIYDFLSLLFCHTEEITPTLSEEIIKTIQALPPSSRFLILARGENGDLKKSIARLLQNGFVRIWLNGKVVHLTEIIDFDQNSPYAIVIDRLSLPVEKSRLEEAIALALEWGQGVMSLLLIDTKEEVVFSSSHPTHFEITNFSFNHPSGMCSECQGMGFLKGAESRCPSCKGSRLNRASSAARFHLKTISEITSLTVEDAANFFQQLPFTTVSKKIIEEIVCRLDFLLSVGVGYITLDRPFTTLSGGESQRVQLASHLASGLVNAIYIVEEPSNGLHPFDHSKLLQSLIKLKEKGNTLIVVEHDPETIFHADSIVDIGPLAGKNGGEIVYTGDVKGILESFASITGAYLSGREKIVIPKKRRPQHSNSLVIKKAHHHNLKNIDVKIPLALFIAVTGVSGSGKSSLILDTLYPALSNHLYSHGLSVGRCESIEGLHLLENLVSLDPTPLQLPPHSNFFTHFNLSPKKGKKFGEGTTLEEAYYVIQASSQVQSQIEALISMGLGYLQIGQLFSTLSSGEVQRIKLAKQLSKVSTKKTLYILDEPTSGLHLHDINILINALQSLVSKGNTVVVIEHNLSLIRTTDWVIELGPKGGPEGGYLLAETTPEKLAQMKTPTGLALTKKLMIPSPLSSVKPPSHITVKGASEYPLKTISADIPLRQMTICTGPSGSGKSAFAFNTLFAEAEHRYLNSLPLSLRERVPLMKKGAVTLIQDVPPAIGVEQERCRISPHATLSGIIGADEFLHPLYAHLGTPHSSKTGEKIPTPESIADSLLTLPHQTKVSLLSPIKFDPEGFEKMKRYLRIRINGIYYELDDPLLLKNGKNPYLVIDRLSIKPENRLRLIESIQDAIALERTVCIDIGNKDLYFDSTPTPCILKIDNHSIADFCQLPIDKAITLIENRIPASLNRLLSLLISLQTLGVGYLSLDRKASTLSRGELGRARLCRYIGSGLNEMLYVLDQPSTGFHPKEIDSLIQVLLKLRDDGHTLLLIENNPAILKKADHILTFGPQAGEKGGMLISQNLLLETPARSFQKNRSSTSSYSLRQCSLHNLKNFDIDIPLNFFSCLIGPSGSGKSTLLFNTLKPFVEEQLRLSPLNQTIEKIVFLGNTSSLPPRSDLSTYVNLLLPLRSLFAQLPLAQARGMQPKHFAFNHQEGRCPHCRGLGVKRVSLKFLPPVEIPCEPCKGYRLNPVSLSVNFKGKHIGKILDLTVGEAHSFLASFPHLVTILDTLISLGLDHPQLKQSFITLSSGEQQRLRLAKAILSASRKKTLFLLDEPTSFLHPFDRKKVILLFHQLIDQGHTLVTIEHNPDVIASANHFIELGPGSGEKGGYLIAQGPPESFSKEAY